jgi:hypothetical protein
MSNNQKLLNFLITEGKGEKSWEQLAREFGLPSGNAARHTWRGYKKHIGKFNFDNKSIQPPSWKDVSKSEKPYFDSKDPKINKYWFSYKFPTGVDAETANYIADLENAVVEKFEDKEKGTAKVEFLHSKEALSDEEIYKECKVDNSKWKLVQIWHKKRSNGFVYSANFKLIQEGSKEDFQIKFIDFLRDFKVDVPLVSRPLLNLEKPNACYVIDKQDFHFNKADVHGNNDVIERLSNYESLTLELVEKASRNYNLDKIVYIIGSDCFNSEWTGMTTKGTPQVNNIISYHQAFRLILHHEILVIRDLMKYAEEVEVLFLAGNHDQYVGWHLAETLKSCFSTHSRVYFDTDPHFRKYVHYSNTAMMFNHGDGAKPQVLANIFPVEFKKWSECDNWLIFVGDKHREMEKNFGGCEFYGIAALSDAKSEWDEKNGFVTNKAKYTSFVIERNVGITDIYKKNIIHCK